MPKINLVVHFSICQMAEKFYEYIFGIVWQLCALCMRKEKNSKCCHFIMIAEGLQLTISDCLTLVCEHHHRKKKIPNATLPFFCSSLKVKKNIVVRGFYMSPLKH